MIHDASKSASERTTLALKPMESPKLGQPMAPQNEPWSIKNFMVGSWWSGMGHGGVKILTQFNKCAKLD